MNAIPSWLTQRERSNAAALTLLIWIARRLGRRAGRAVLAPATAYFLVFSRAARAASTAYLRRVLGREPGVADLFRHFYTFATVALDRVFFLSGRLDLFDIKVWGEEHLDARRARGEGCFMAGAHLGSFEALAARARSRGLRVSQLMFERNAERTAQAVRKLAPGLQDEVIQLGDPGSMLRVAERLARGEWIGMLADRILHPADERLTLPFLGGRAQFPTAPFRVAALTGQPVVLMVALYRGGNRYELCFEELAPGDWGADRREAVQALTARYAERLEHYCRVAPYNWFNFYDFWHAPA